MITVTSVVFSDSTQIFERDKRAMMVWILVPLPLARSLSSSLIDFEIEKKKYTYRQNKFLRRWSKSTKKRVANAKKTHTRTNERTSERNVYHPVRRPYIDIQIMQWMTIKTSWSRLREAKWRGGRTKRFAILYIQNILRWSAMWNKKVTVDYVNSETYVDRGRLLANSSIQSSRRLCPCQITCGKRCDGLRQTS